MHQAVNKPKKIILLGAGFFLISAGLTGFIIPVMPGFPLIFAGLSVCEKGDPDMKIYRLRIAALIADLRAKII